MLSFKNLQYSLFVEYLKGIDEMEFFFFGLSVREFFELVYIVNITKKKQK